MHRQKCGENMSKFEALFYETENGSKPAEEYLLSISPKMVAKLYKAIDYVEQHGSQSGFPYSEHLRDGIFQIRAQQEGNISRVLYFFSVGQKIILTHGFTKKTEKTPPSEIEKAIRYRADYYNREGKK